MSDIIDFMSHERHFDIFMDSTLPAGADLGRTLHGAIHERMSMGGYLTLFWSKQASESMWVEHELREVLQTYADRVMPALSEDAPLPSPLSEVIPVRLYRADGSGLDRRRLVDLIVRLYWLIRRNREENSEEA